MSKDIEQECFYKIAEGYTRSFFQDKEKFLKEVGKFASIRGCLVQVYRNLVERKICEPIENLSQEEKRELWAEAKRISSIQEQKYLLDVVKALVGLGQFIQIENHERTA